MLSEKAPWWKHHLGIEGYHLDNHWVGMELEAVLVFEIIIINCAEMVRALTVPGQCSNDRTKMKPLSEK